MGNCDPDLDLGPPFVELLGRPIIVLKGHNNLLSMNGTCGGRGDIGLVGEELVVISRGRGKPQGSGVMVLRGQGGGHQFLTPQPLCQNPRHPQ